MTLAILRSLALILVVPFFGATVWAQRCTRPPAQQFGLETIPEESRFGISLSVSGDRVIVGADFGNDLMQRAGSAYVFRRDDQETPTEIGDDTWVLEGALESPSPRPRDWFGYTVALDGRRAVVGAVSPYDGFGEAFVFVLDDNGSPLDSQDDFWRIEQELRPPGTADWRYFGARVGIHGTWAFVIATTPDGMTEAVHVFRQSLTTEPGTVAWVHTEALTASDAGVQDAFGASIVTDGDRLIIGASLSGGFAGNSGAGAAYVFRRNDNSTPDDPVDDSWNEAFKLAAADPGDLDLFGEAASLGGNRIIVGARGNNGNAGPNVGVAYVFRLDDNGTPTNLDDDSWLQESKLVPCDPEPNSDFGAAVSIVGDTAVVGTFRKSAYLFERRDGVWLQKAKLDASLGPYTGLGNSAVGIGPQFVLVSDHGTPTGMPNSRGKVFVFPIDPTPTGLPCFADFQACFSGAGTKVTSCCRTFSADDSDVDLVDYNIFWKAWQATLPP